MKSKKVTMLAAALVVAVVALAGVGYAAVTEYKATTTNTGNNLGYTYLKIEQTGAGAYNDEFFSAAYFNTVNTGTYSSTAGVSSVTTYTPVNDYAMPVTNSEIATGTAVALVSKILQLTITPENIGEKETANLEVTVNSLTPVDGLHYYMVLATSASNTYTCVNVVEYQPVSPGSTSYSWNFGSIAIDNENAKDYYVMLFIGGNTTENATLTDINTAGFSANCGFTFTLTETVV